LYLHIPASALAIASGVSHLTIPGASQSNTVKVRLVEEKIRHPLALPAADDSLFITQLLC
jgi:hypothetical protein